MNILITLAEVCILIVVFIICRWLVGKLFKLLVRLSILKGDDIKIKILRRNITGLLLLVCILLCVCNTLLSKQVLMADLQAGGFDAQLVNLKAGDCKEPFGEVTWKGMNLTKAYVGQRIYDI
ncbi:MAG: hypothetical protein ACKPB7_15765, partial [Sphaerospermopsis kisseleviana]